MDPPEKPIFSLTRTALSTMKLLSSIFVSSKTSINPSESDSLLSYWSYVDQPLYPPQILPPPPLLLPIGGGCCRGCRTVIRGSSAHLPRGLPAARPQVRWDYPGHPPCRVGKEHICQGAEAGAGPGHPVRAGGRPTWRQQAAHLRPGQPDQEAREPPGPVILPLPALRSRGGARVRVRRGYWEDPGFASNGMVCICLLLG